MVITEDACVCARVCMCVCARARGGVCVRVCVRVCAEVMIMGSGGCCCLSEKAFFVSPIASIGIFHSNSSA